MYKTNISEKLVSLNMSIVTSTHQLTLSLTVTQVECSILKQHSKVIKLRFKITLAQKLPKKFQTDCDNTIYIIQLKRIKINIPWRKDETCMTDLLAGNKMSTNAQYNSSLRQTMSKLTISFALLTCCAVKELLQMTWTIAQCLVLVSLKYHLKLVQILHKLGLFTPLKFIILNKYLITNLCQFSTSGALLRNQ